jgi:hypothetical protein
MDRSTMRPDIAHRHQAALANASAACSDANAAQMRSSSTREEERAMRDRAQTSRAWAHALRRNVDDSRQRFGHRTP